MKKLLCVLLVFSMLAVRSACAQQGNLEWVGKFSGTAQEVGNSIAVDGNGNVYTIGQFQGTVDFNPGPGTFNLSSQGQDDVFIAKLDGQGNFLWAKQLGGTIKDQGISIAIDGNNNIIASGIFQGTVDFDPGIGAYNLTSSGGDDIFILKLNVFGDFEWVKQFGGSLNERVKSITIDGSNNVYSTGYFGGIVDFDPGTGVYNLNSPGNSDAFILKLDADGNFVWAKQLGGSGGDAGNSIVFDANGFLYLAGYFSGNVFVELGAGNANLSSVGGRDVFISKIDLLGNFLWVKQWGGTGNDYINSIAVDIMGNVYSTGSFELDVDFDPNLGITNLSSFGEEDVFVSKLDPLGNLVWIKQMGGIYTENGNSVVVDNNGFVYTTGFFQGTVDFDPGLGNFNLSFLGYVDVFISKLDPSGNFVWALAIGGTQEDVALCMVIDSNNFVYTSGYFQGTVDFDPGVNNVSLSSQGVLDVFVHKMATCLTITGVDFQTACSTYTWIDGIEYTSSNNTATYTLTNAAGCDSIVTLNLTIDTPVNADLLTDLTICDTYELPVLTTGNYFTETNGGGTQLNAGDLVDATQTLYVYAENGTCSDETSFIVTIDDPIQVDEQNDLTACDPYELPVLTVGNYFTETSGGGTQMNAGDMVDATQTLYVYAENGTCSDETSFTVTINENPDNGISLDGLTLSADAIGADYLWLDCNNAFAPISGETGQSFTATANGSYAVQVSANGCELVSECVEITTVDLDESMLPMLTIHPNPSSGLFYLITEHALEFQLRNIQGQIIHSGRLNPGKNILDLSDMANGIYIISIGSDNNRLLKQ